MVNALQLLKRHPVTFNENIFEMSIDKYRARIETQSQRYLTKLHKMLRHVDDNNKHSNETHYRIYHFRERIYGHFVPDGETGFASRDKYIKTTH